MRPFGRKLWDFVLLQVGWFVCVLGGAAGNAWIGPVMAAVCIALHCLWIAPAASRARELRNVLVFGSIGTLIDVVQVRLGVLCFPTDTFTVAGVPPWLAALWFLFPILFHSAFTWLHGRPLLAALLAGIGAPLSYRAGVALDALRLGSEEWTSLFSLGLAWALYLPLALPRTR